MSKRLKLAVCLSLFVYLSLFSFVSPARPAQITGSAGSVLEVEEITEFDEPWAMTFLPGGDLLVTEKSGN